MRLKHIQLAGFKSFVDPTQVSFPGQLAAVVGPNGCGKSNIIDAVRWVMGESSAKQLRGESIADVIFNGAAGRNPVGQASVELVFDNSEGKMGGEYARYNEVALRRVVNRDGQSIYYLNNTRCRRRDIMDIFRGTGLGPRSYAIIEQGMISRMIDAKPEELRVYLEEAAGITKYKDRRRETELRIEHTRVNLARLSDLREELGNQIERLQRQAKAAEKYKELKAEEYQYNTQLHALRWQGLDQQISSQRQLANELAVTYERHAADHTHTVAEIEHVRLSFTAQNEQVQECQAEYYAASAEVSRIEQEINHLKQRKLSLERDLADAKQHYETAQALTITDKENIARHETALEETTPLIAEEQEKLQTLQEQLQNAEQALAKWQHQWDALHQELAHQQKNTELLNVQIKHAEEQLNGYQQRLLKLQEEQQKLDTSAISAERDALEVQLKEATARHEELSAQIEEKTELLNKQQSSNNDCRHQLHEVRVALQQAQGQHASFEALQKAALGHDNAPLTEWLTQKELINYPRLAAGLSVTSGWEFAVEFVLKEFLPAVVLDKLEAITDVSDWPGQLCVYLPKSSQGQLPESVHPVWHKLGEHIDTNWPLTGILAGIFCVPDLATALSWRHQLLPHESLITPEGVWIGQDWIRVYQPDATKAGVITRQQTLATLEKQIAEQTLQIEKLAAQLQEGEQQVLTWDKEREALRSVYQQQQKEHAQQNAKVQELTGKMAHQQQRDQAITQELTEIEQAIAGTKERMETIQTEQINSQDQLENTVKQQQNLAHERETAHEQVRQMRASVDAQRDHVHRISVQVNTLQSELNGARTSLARIEQQVADLANRQQQIHDQLAVINEPLTHTDDELSNALATRVTSEEQLASVRDKLSEVERHLRDLENEQGSHAQLMDTARNELETARLSLATAEARCTTIVEQLTALEAELTAVIQGLPEHANEHEWANELEAIGQRIKRLGAINLAAIEEYASART